MDKSAAVRSLSEIIPMIRFLEQGKSVDHEKVQTLKLEMERLKSFSGEGDVSSIGAPDVEQFIGYSASVLQYRQSYYEANGRVAGGHGLPCAHSWPEPDRGKTYGEKMIDALALDGRGVELGPLQIPIITREQSRVLYVDHLDTAGIQAKYPGLTGLMDIDRPIVNNSLVDTLSADAPLDYLLASQVLEHVANPIKWLQEIAQVLKVGGRLSLALPDRRTSFDLLREESHAADWIAAYLENASVPNVRAVYEHHAQTTLVNMKWAREESVTPEEVVAGRGAVLAPKVTDDHMSLVARAQAGEYLDVHAWVFTPPSFLIMLAQIVGEGMLPYRLHQFYPTNFNSGDRGSYAFIAILERVGDDFDADDLRKTFLSPLGPE